MWSKVRWLLVLLTPLLATSVAASTRSLGGGFVVLVMGSAVSCALFATLSSGVSRSNHGTLVRSQNPIGFWIDVSILAAGYAFILLAGFQLYAPSLTQVVR